MQFLSIIGTVNRWVGKIVSFLVVLVIALILFEVISRFAFNCPTIWVHETAEQMYGFYIVIGGGYVLLNKAHIRVDVFWSYLSLRKKAAIDLATCVFAFLFLTVMLWFSGRSMYESILMHEHSITAFGPLLYPLKASLVLGVLLLLLQLIAKFIVDLHIAIKGVEYG